MDVREFAQASCTGICPEKHVSSNLGCCEGTGGYHRAFRLEGYTVVI